MDDPMDVDGSSYEEYEPQQVRMQLDTLNQSPPGSNEKKRNFADYSESQRLCATEPTDLVAQQGYSRETEVAAPVINYGGIPDWVKHHPSEGPDFVHWHETPIEETLSYRVDQVLKGAVRATYQPSDEGEQARRAPRSERISPYQLHTRNSPLRPHARSIRGKYVHFSQDPDNVRELTDISLSSPSMASRSPPSTQTAVAHQPQQPQRRKGWYGRVYRVISNVYTTFTSISTDLVNYFRPDPVALPSQRGSKRRRVELSRKMPGGWPGLANPGPMSILKVVNPSETRTKELARVNQIESERKAKYAAYGAAAAEQLQTPPDSRPTSSYQEPNAPDIVAHEPEASPQTTPDVPSTVIDKKEASDSPPYWQNPRSLIPPEYYAGKFVSERFKRCEKAIADRKAAEAAMEAFLAEAERKASLDSARKDKAVDVLLARKLDLSGKSKSSIEKLRVKRLAAEKAKAGAETTREHDAKAAEKKKREAERIQKEQEENEKRLKELAIEAEAKKQAEREERLKKEAEEAAKKKVEEEATAKAKAEQKKAEEEAIAKAKADKKTQEKDEEKEQQRFVKPLSEAMEDILMKAMNTKRMDRQLATATDGSPVTRYDLGRIFQAAPQDDDWLNDVGVNTWFTDLVDRKNTQLGYVRSTAATAPAAPFASYNCGWWTNASAKGVDSIRTWSRRKGIQGPKLLQTEKIFLPINHQRHWTLVVISPRVKTITYYDSLEGRHSYAGPLQVVREWLKMELGNAFKPADWKDLTRMSNRQDNTSDCGVFTCFNALADAKGVPSGVIEAKDMKLARKVMAATLLNGGFTGEFDL